MPKSAVSVTLDQENLLWLRGQAKALKRRSLSETLDEIVTAARMSGGHAGPVKSVVGTVDIAATDPSLDTADEYIKAVFATSASRPFLVRHAASRPGGKKRGRG